jgi:hypothetical protein
MSNVDPGTAFDPAKCSLSQRLGAILWPSFFAAGVATMVFFALFDPQDLFHLLRPESVASRGLGYTLGFFLFWIATAGSSLFTWILLCPGNRYRGATRDD